jgi:hypothetical protein
MIVMDRDLHDAEAGILNLSHQLQTNHATIPIELDTVEYFAAHQPEIAVDVAHTQRKKHLHRVVVDASDDDPVQRIGPADFVAGHHVGVLSQTCPQRRDLGGIVLRIAVGVGDELLGCGGEARSQRAPVSPVAGVVDYPDVGVSPRELVGDLSGLIAAAVVDDDDFKVRRQPADRLLRLNH